MVYIDGLISGLDTSSIIEQLMHIERRPITQIQTRISLANDRKLAFMNVSAKLLALQGSTSALASHQLYNNTKISSSAPSILSVTGSGTVSPGSYTFRVARLAQSEQRLSSGFADSNQTAVGAGTMTIELGGAFLDRNTRLDFFNGQQGVARGSIKITDRSGVSDVVSLTAAVDMRDVLELVNNSSASVEMSVDGDRLVITDTSGGSGNLSVSEVSGGKTAADLGILGSTASDTLTGTDINFVTNQTALELLNDGRGVRIRAGDDFTISTRSGESFGVSIDGAKTLGDVVSAIANDADNNGKISAAVSGKHLVLTDNTTWDGISVFSVTAGSSQAAYDLGIEGAAAADTLTGSDVIAGIDTVLLKSLNGGQGLSSGSFIITGRDGVSTATFDVANYATLQDLVDAIAGTAFLDADLNLEGNGLTIRDTSGSSAAALKIEENGSTVAAELGILTETKSAFESTQTGTSFTDSSLIGIADDFFNGALFENISTAETATVTGFDGATGTVTLDTSYTFNQDDAYALRGVNASEYAGESANFGYVGEMTRLDTLNGGRGVFAGKIKITDADGNTATVDLSQADDVYIEDVLSEINAVATNVTATINAAGNGLLLTDSSAGSGQLRVEEAGGTTAADLNILGTSDTGVIDGSFKFTVTTDENDTLEDLRNKINDLGVRVQAGIINDGSGLNPYRLSLISEVPGGGGRILVDGASLGIDFSTTSRGRDAAVVFGSEEGGGQPVLIESSTNTVSSLIEGMTMHLLSTSDSPVTVTAVEDTSGLADQVKNFVADFNAIMETVDTYTSFDMEAKTRGVLLGNASVRRIQSDLRRMVTTPVSELPSDFNTLRAIGIQITGQGVLTLDESKLSAAIAADAERVEELFSRMQTVTGNTKLSEFEKGEGLEIIPTADDFKITRRDGVELDVDLAGAVYLKDVLEAINNHANNADNKLVASLSADGRKIVLDDYTGGTGTLKTSVLNGSKALSGLGLFGVASGSTLTGREIDLGNNPGIARKLGERLDYMTREDGGLVALATGRLDQQIKIYNDRIERLEKHIEKLEERYRRQFTAMEQILAQSESTMGWLSQNLGSLTSMWKKD